MPPSPGPSVPQEAEDPSETKPLPPEKKREPPIREVRSTVNFMKVPPASTGDGILVILATPWANVSIDGHPVGETPREIRIGEGTYLLRATHPQLGTTRKTVTVVAGKRQMWKALLSH